MTTPKTKNQSKAYHRDKAKVKRLISNMDDQTALPRKNGELVFQSPWESKTFGLAVALHEKGLYDWDEFRKALIDEIKQWNSKHNENDEEWSYYERWLSSLEKILLKKGIFTKKELDQRTEEFEKGLRDDNHHPH